MNIVPDVFLKLVGRTARESVQNVHAWLRAVVVSILGSQISVHTALSRIHEELTPGIFLHKLNCHQVSALDRMIYSMCRGGGAGGTRLE